MASKKQAVETNGKQRHRRTDEEMLAEFKAKVAKMEQRIEERKNKVDVPKVGRGFLNLIKAMTNEQLERQCKLVDIGLNFGDEVDRDFMIKTIIDSLIDEANTK